MSARRPTPEPDHHKTPTCHSTCDSRTEAHLASDCGLGHPHRRASHTQRRSVRAGLPHPRRGTDRRLAESHAESSVARVRGLHDHARTGQRAHSSGAQLPERRHPEQAVRRVDTGHAQCVRSIVPGRHRRIHRLWGRVGPVLGHHDRRRHNARPGVGRHRRRFGIGRNVLLGGTGHHARRVASKTQRHGVPVGPRTDVPREAALRHLAPLPLHVRPGPLACCSQDLRSTVLRFRRTCGRIGCRDGPAPQRHGPIGGSCSAVG